MEDNISVRHALTEYLTGQGFDIVAASGQTEALEKLKVHSPDIALLDIMLDDGDGMTLFQEMRRTSAIPTIFLSGKSEDTERIIGLEIGADDYITKPFNPRELSARIKAVLRRAKKPEQKSKTGLSGTEIRFGECSFHSLTHELTNARGQTVVLSKGERKLLMAFLSNPHKILSRDTLLDVTQSKRAGSFDRSVDNLISRLRKKLEVDPKSPKLIKTYWGGGYALTVDVTSH